MLIGRSSTLTLDDIVKRMGPKKKKEERKLPNKPNEEE